MGFSRLEYWSGLSVPPPVDHVLSELSTMICPSWVALHGMAHSFVGLHKPLCHNKAVIHEDVLQSMGSQRFGHDLATKQQLFGEGVHFPEGNVFVPLCNSALT